MHSGAIVWFLHATIPAASCLFGPSDLPTDQSQVLAGHNPSSLLSLWSLRPTDGPTTDPPTTTTEKTMITLLAAHLRELASMDLTQEARDHLRRMALLMFEPYMSELSEEYWAAGWVLDLEYLLFQELNKTGSEPGLLTPEEKHTLRLLADLSGCWLLTYDSDSNETPARIAIPLSEWQGRHYAPWAEALAARNAERDAAIAACEADGGHDWAPTLFGGRVCACGAYEDPPGFTVQPCRLEESSMGLALRPTHTED